MSLTIAHADDAGFFSCCTVKLHYIVEYINEHHKLPTNINSDRLFTLYNPVPSTDITYTFFKPPHAYDYTYKNALIWHYKHQFEPYSMLDFANILPLVKIYFEPSQTIKAIEHNLVKNYDICHDNCIALYYRGTDKSCETLIDSYESFYNKLIELQQHINNKQIQILIQTDTSQFLEYMMSKLTDMKNVIIIKELLPSHTNYGTHHERTKEQNYNDIQQLCAVVQIAAKCRYIICSSGSVSNWIVLYRGNADNVYQNLNYKWI